MINTLRATAIAPDSGDTWLGAGSGGLSGPAVKPVALEQVRRVAAEVSIAVIGMGGIETASDAAEFMALGADFVAVGLANFRDPGPRAESVTASNAALRTPRALTST